MDLDAAVQSIKVARREMEDRNYGRAIKFFEKAKRLHPILASSQNVDKLIDDCEKKMCQTPADSPLPQTPRTPASPTPSSPLSPERA